MTAMPFKKPFKSITYFILFDRWQIRILIMFLALLGTFAGLAVPYFQREFLTQLEPQPLLICTGLALGSFLFLQMTNFLGQRESLIAQQKLSRWLYQHILNLKSQATQSKSIGEMVALYTTDIPSGTMWLEQTIPYALTTAFPLILAPIFLNLLYDIPYSLTFGMIISVIALNLFLARRQSYFFSRFKSLAGQRMGLVNEWIQNIRALKTLNWIRGFENKIIKKRIEETNNRISMVTNGQMMNSISSSITFWLNLAVLFFIALTIDTNVVHIDLMAILWVMGIFLSRPLRQLPWFFTMMFDAWTSIKRLNSFFELINQPYAIKNELTQHSPQTYLQVENLSLNLQSSILLNQISFTVHSHECVALIGPVGSGKSLLLKSLIKETPFTADNFYMIPHSYLPQEPFVLSASVHQNITFDYEENNSEVENQKCLQSLKNAQFDLNQDRLNEGLATQIGERGLNISGGQKQRLNLARILYQPQKLFLLDDPFSAVDIGTEDRLTEVFIDLKKSGHSFLIITQRYSILEKCDRILFMNKGQIEFSGTYPEFIQIKKYASFIAGTEFVP